MEEKKSNLISRWLIVSFLVFSVIGFADASYLTFTHYQNIALECLGGGSCDKVTASVYSTIGQIPVALLGTFYYAGIFALAAVYLWSSRKKYLEAGSESNRDFVMSFMARFTVLGFLASLWFVYLQVFVIKAICIYCMGSAFTSTILFILGLLAMSYEKKIEPETAA